MTKIEHNIEVNIFCLARRAAGPTPLQHLLWRCCCEVRVVMRKRRSNLERRGGNNGNLLFGCYVFIMLRDNN
jgi:hypothetical protein